MQCSDHRFLCFVSIPFSRLQLFFDFFDDLLVSFFEPRFFFPCSFAILFSYVLYRFLELVLVCLTGAIFLWSTDREGCHDTSVVTSHVYHVVGFAVFVVSQVPSLDYNVVDLLLISYRRSVSRLFSNCLLVHRVQCRISLYYQPMFHPVPSLVSSVECVCVCQHLYIQFRNLIPSQR